MKNHYVIFGNCHIHNINGKTLDHDCVAVFKAKDGNEGRKKAIDLFGYKFFTDYHDTDWKEEELKYFPKGYIYLNV